MRHNGQEIGDEMGILTIEICVPHILQGDFEGLPVMKLDNTVIGLVKRVKEYKHTVGRVMKLKLALNREGYETWVASGKLLKGDEIGLEVNGQTKVVEGIKLSSQQPQLILR